MIINSNSIQKLILDIQVNVDKSNNDVFDKFSSIANFHAIPTIDNYFDSIIPKDVVIEIDHLELDLGLINYKDLDTVFKDNLLKALKNIFDQYFNTDNNQPSQSNSLFTVKNLPDNQLAFVRHYLLFGRIPWWANYSSPNFNDSILQIIKSSPIEFRLLLYEIGRDESVRKRLAFSLHEDVIKKVITILEPSESEFIFGYHKTLSKLNKEKQTVKVEEKQFNRSLWYLILTYIIYNRGGNFNRREFLKQNIHNAANQHNISYQTLLTLMYNALEIYKINSELSNNIVQNLFDNILILIQEDNLIEITEIKKDKKLIKKKSTPEKLLEEKLSILNYYLERGTFPIDSSHYSLNDIVSILELFLNENSELLFRYFTASTFNSQMIKRLFEVLPSNSYNRLILLLTPKNFSIKVVDLQKSFILFLVHQHSSTSILLTSEWKLSVLSYLTNSRNSIIIPNLINQFIYQIADKLQLSYNRILTLYQKDLLRQIHTAEYTTSVLEKIASQIDLLVQVNEPSYPVASQFPLEDSLNEDNRYYGIADLLRFVIFKGYIPWWGKNYLIKSLVQLMIDLYSFNSKQAISIFKSASAQMVYRNRFIQFFTPDFTRNILQFIWNNETDWILYNSIENIFQSIPSILNKPIDKTTNNIILHAFWKILLDGSFSVFDKDNFIRLSFLMLQKYHSFDSKEIFLLINTANASSGSEGLQLNENQIVNIQKLFDNYHLPYHNEELLDSNNISSILYFELLLTSLVFGNKKITKSKKIKEILEILNYFIKNLSFPPYLNEYLINKKSDYFSFLLGYLYSLDHEKFTKIIDSNILSSDHPVWLSNLFQFNRNLYLLPVKNLKEISTKDLSSFDSILRSIVYSNKVLPNDQKANAVFQLINYFIDNLSFPQNISESLKNNSEAFFSYLLDILFSLDNSKYTLLIEKGFKNTKNPSWFYTILENNNLSLFPSFDFIVRLIVFKNNDLSNDQKINSIIELISFYLDNLSFPQYLSASLKNRSEDFFSYILGILYSLDPSKHNQIIVKGFSIRQKPSWFYSILEKNDYSKLKSNESILLSIVFKNNDLSKDQKISSVFQLINYFIDNLSFPSYLSDFLNNKPEEFFSYLFDILYSLDKAKHTQLVQKGLVAIKKPTWFYSIVENNNFLVFSNKVLLNSTSESYSFDQWIYLIIYQNKEISHEMRVSEIVKIVTYFIDNLSFPTQFPEYLKNKQPLFFSHLMGHLFSMNQAIFSEIINRILFSSNKPLWFFNLVQNIQKQTNFSNLGIKGIVSSDLLYVDTGYIQYFDNDNTFIHHLLGFKPITHNNNNLTIISKESSTLLLFLLTNQKLPVKYEFLSRYDFSFLITILFRFLFTNNEVLFNQVLSKFTSFPSASRILLFKLFKGKTSHPTDELITEQLIPYITVEVDSQKKLLEKDILLKNNKISTTVSNKFNEWINKELNIKSNNREDILLNLFSYFLENGKFYDSFNSFTGYYLTELLRILVLEISRFDTKKLLSILSLKNNNIDAKNIVINLFSQGANIEERSIHSILQSVNFGSVINNNLNESFNEFDIQNINPLFENQPFNEVGIREFFKKTLGLEIISNKVLLDNSLNIVIFYLLHKKKDPQFKKITEDSFILYFKEILWIIFTEQPAILRDLLSNSLYSLTNKVAVLSLYSQISDKKDMATRFFIQPIIENEIFIFIESMVDKKIANREFKDVVNNLLKQKLVSNNFPILKLLQFVQSKDLMDEFIQAQLSQSVTKNIDKLQEALLKQVLTLFNAALSNMNERNEFSNFLIRFNSYSLSEAHLIVNIEIYLRKMIQFLLYHNRTRSIYFFSKFIFYTDNLNFSFSFDYSRIVNSLRKIFIEFIHSSDLAIAAEKDDKNDSKGNTLLDKINDVVTDFLADEKENLPESIDSKLPVVDFIEPNESIYVNNAGLVIFNPYITTLFSRLGITENGKFKDEESVFRAIHLLQLLVTDAPYEEHELVLNKILCNLPVSSPVPMDIVLKQSEKLLVKDLIEVTMSRWKKGASGSIENFRASFINRDGRLSIVNEVWNLKVDQRGYDILLNSLPWSYGMIKLPWMLKPLTVEWV